MRESFENWHGEPLKLGHGAHERRADTRHVAVRWLAQLEAAERRELCVVHNICSTGLIAEIFTPCALGEPVRIDLSEEQQLSGTVVWTSAANVEIRFVEPIDLGELVEAHSAAGSPTPDAPPRMEVSCQGWLEFGNETFMVEVCDLSQGGARIAADVSPALGQAVLLVVQGLAPVAGEIRWREDGMLGVAFEHPIAFDALTGWIVERDAEVGSHGQSRRWPRYSILLKTLARLGDVTQPIEAMVHNISRGGVLVSCRRGLKTGDSIELTLGSSGLVAGLVRWVGNGYAGIAFTRTIDAEHVLHPLGERSVPPVLHHRASGRRPGLKIH